MLDPRALRTPEPSKCPLRYPTPTLTQHPCALSQFPLTTVHSLPGCRPHVAPEHPHTQRHRELAPATSSIAPLLAPGWPVHTLQQSHSCTSACCQRHSATHCSLTVWTYKAGLHACGQLRPICKCNSYLIHSQHTRHAAELVQQLTCWRTLQYRTLQSSSSRAYSGREALASISDSRPEPEAKQAQPAKSGPWLS